MTKGKILKYILTWAINTFSVMVAAWIIPGINYGDNFFTLIFAALVLGVLNTLLKPVLVVLALPLMLLTVGLFYFFINAFLLLVVTLFVPGFEVEGFISALLGSMVISFVSLSISFLIGKKRLLFNLSAENSNNDKDDNLSSSDKGGKGPIIDV